MLVVVIITMLVVAHCDCCGPFSLHAIDAGVVVEFIETMKSGSDDRLDGRSSIPENEIVVIGVAPAVVYNDWHN